MDPTWAPEGKGFLLGCLVAQCEQSPSVALQVRDDVGIARVFPTNILTSASSCWHRFLFFSCLLPPRRMDRCRPSDTADRSAPETVGPGFRRRPSSVLPAHLGNGLTPCGERAGGPSAKGSTYIHQHWGEERRCGIKYWIFFGKGIGTPYLWKKAEAAKASQHSFLSFF